MKKLHSLRINIAIFLAMCIALLFFAIPGAIAQEISDSETADIVIYFTGECEGILSLKEGKLAHDKIATLVDETLKKTPATLLVNTGNSIFGNYSSYLSGGESSIEIMNAAGYDAMVMGTHEFDFGYDYLHTLAVKAHFPFLVQNSVQTESDALLSSVLFERGGYKIGIFGLTSPSAQQSSLASDRDFGTPSLLISQAKETAISLRNQGADIVICLSHLGNSNDYANDYGTVFDISNNVLGIDLIIDGNSRQITSISGEFAPIVYSSYDNTELGCVRFYETSDGKFTMQTSYYTNEQLESYESDVITASITQKWEDAAAESGSEFITSNSFDFGIFDKEAVRIGETLIGNFITDSLREISGADAAIIESGKICGVLNVGDNNWRNFCNMLPFTENLVTAEVSGRVLQQALAFSLELITTENADGVLQFSGLQITYDLALDVSDRLLSVSIGGEPLEQDKTYLVALPEYVAKGRYGYDMFANSITKFETVGDITTLIADYSAEHNGNIKSEIDGRAADLTAKLEISERSKSVLGIIVFGLLAIALLCLVLALVVDRRAKKAAEPQDENSKLTQKSGWVFILMTIAYIVFILILNTISTPQRTNAYIDLDNADYYLKAGFDPATLSTPNLDDSWYKLQDTLNINATDYLEEYKSSSFSISDGDPIEFTYAIKFDTSVEFVSYIRREMINTALYIPAIADNWEFFLNGNAISRNIFLDENGKISNHREMQQFYLNINSSSLLQHDNILLIRVLCDPNYDYVGLYRNGGMYIEDVAAMPSPFGSMAIMITFGVFVFLIFYNIMLFMRDRNDKRHLFFALLVFLIVIYMLTNSPFMCNFVNNTYYLILLEYLSLELIGVMLIMFIKSIFGARFNLFDKICFAAIAIIAVMTCLGGLTFSSKMLAVGQIATVVTSVYAIGYLCRRTFLEVRSYKREEGIGYAAATMHIIARTFCGNIFLGIVIAAIITVIGVLSASMFKQDTQNMLIWAYTVLVSVGFALNDDVAKEKSHVAEENTLLEEMVSDRTAQLAHQVTIANYANESKSRFLATMSHEIRTPLNAILGIAEVQLMDDSISENHRGGLVTLRSSAYGLLAIINDILDLTKIETGKLEINCAGYDVARLIYDTVQLNIVRIGSKRISFVLDVSPDIPSRLLGDELRIKQIFNNIISNAIKYTDEGCVKLSIGCEKGDAAENQVFFKFSVADTGQGMKPEDVQNLFAEYTRFNHEANRTTEGTGLGMSITYNLVKLMDGTIDVESQLGVGSTFTVRISQKCLSPETLGREIAASLNEFRFQDEYLNDAEAVTYEPMPYARVLIVDDVDTNLFVARGIMEPYHLQIETVLSGYEAIRRVEAGEVYDIIFMDHMMPGLDGIETAKILRKDGYSGTIIALTANAIHGTEKLFFSNGFNDFLTKPIDLKKLREIFENHIISKQSPETLEKAKNYIPPKERAAETDAERNEIAKFALETAKAALKTLDYRAIEKSAHSVSLAFSAAGEKELSSIALELEMSAQIGDEKSTKRQAAVFIEKLGQMAKNEEAE